MKAKILTGLLLVFWMTANAQVKNDGGTIEVFPGASLIVHMNVENVNSGNLVVNGTLVIEGEYLNELGSTLTTGPAAVLSVDNSSQESMLAPENLNPLNPPAPDESRDTLKIPQTRKSDQRGERTGQS
ncbi:MAG: hypothetical protein OEM26_16520 [Saprospiraceae bacterium]|nr:hypothetical protein [Saprospiraceae bacterium]